MKNIFTLFAGLFLTISAFAFDNTRLSISSFTNKDLQIEIDGRKQNFKNNAISLRNLSTGYHTIKIFRETKKKNNGWFGNNKSKQEIIYNSSINIKNGYHVDIAINRFGKVLVDERRMDRNDEWYDEDDYDDNGNGHDNDDWGSGRAMTEREFSQAKESLRREHFENTRMSLAKQIIDQNRFTSDQVKQILQMFAYENSKLDLAKYAYGKTTDKRNYYIVNDVFIHSSSKDELARYIRNY